MAPLPPQEGTPGGSEPGSARAEDPELPAAAAGPGAASGPPELGLRERKKARTRALIRREAYRLFASQGYDQTTIEQIAAAAEVSPSTFFRYFPSKEALVLLDEYEPLLVDALRGMPDGVPPVAAVRVAIRAAFEALPAEELARYRERVGLAMSVLELRAAWMSSTARVGSNLTKLLAERTGRAVDDPAVRLFVGALGGLWVAVIRHWAAHPDRNLVCDMDQALEFLEAGLPL